jgi:hypothetical protein
MGRGSAFAGVQRVGPAAVRLCLARWGCIHLSMPGLAWLRHQQDIQGGPGVPDTAPSPLPSPASSQPDSQVMHQFLRGMHDVDAHFSSAPLEANLPALLGLLNVWNATFLGHATCAILPYQQALSKFAPHIQQVPGQGWPLVFWQFGGAGRGWGAQWACMSFFEIA